jgi:hypothetical protein
MPAMIVFPSVVQDILASYGDLFANAPERRHFAEYLTGLFIAERKTVSGINREFAITTDQSCLNRSLTEVAWDTAALNIRRLEQLQSDPSTRYTKHGVIAIDNTLIDHAGKLIADVGWFWDHADHWNSAASARRKPALPTGQASRTTPCSAKNWSIGSSSRRSCVIFPSTATSPMPKS